MALKLDQYQLDAVNKLKTGSILCGGVGSGKSLTSLYYYFVKVCEGSIDPKFVPMKKPLDLYIITTAKKRDLKEWEFEMASFDLNNAERYGIKVVVDSWENVKKYKFIENSFFIFDEQRVCGYGVWAKSFIEISKHNEWILLTATPGDKWEDYIPVFIANGFYKNKTDFMREHAVYNPYLKYHKVDRYIGERKLLRLKKEILIEMDYKNTTEQHHEYIKAVYDRDQYKRVMKYRWDIYEDCPIENASRLCSVIRRITNEDSSRATIVQGICLMHPRVIIFYNFDYELEILKNIDYGKDVVVTEWNGHRHDKIPESEKWTYLVQYTAGAEGWNCTDTDTIVFYSQNYSYKIMVQSAGRIDRRNTPYKDLYYYHIKSDAPIDMAISRALKMKKTFNESTFAQKFDL